MYIRGMEQTSVTSRLQSARLWLAARLAGVAILLFLTCGPSVMAENNGTSSSSTFFLKDRQSAPVQRLRRQRPSGQVSASRPNPRYAAPSWRRPPAATVLAADKPAPAIAPRFFAAVLGDSLGVLIGQGLQEAYADRPEIAVLRKAKESSGIVRDDFFDWSKAATDLLAGGEPIDVAVLMIGSNDRQEIPDKTSPVPFRAADGTSIAQEWLDAYGNRVEALAAKFREKHVPLVWVGMPVMKNDKMSAEMIQLNEIFRNRATKAGAVYVDVWDAFLNDGGKFDTFGPDLNGEIVKLRSADGIHFTKAGARKLAHFVEGEIKRIFDTSASPDLPVLAAVPPQAVQEPARPAADTGVAGVPTAELADADINAILKQQMGGAGHDLPAASPVAGTSGLVALPLPAEPAPLFLPLRPVAGPVLTLTALALTPSGDLASRQDRKPAASEALALIDRAFAEGRLAQPRPGRADDFAWPRR